MTPAVDLEAHPAVRAAAALAGDLAADAARLEREGVDATVLDRLAAAGLLAVPGPEELGGAPAPVQRRVAELLAGASPDAWFVWFQHGPVVKALTRSDNAALAAQWLPRLCSGASRGGVAYSHLRTPRPSVTARPVDGGWLLDGRQPWCTGWGLVDVVLAGAHVVDSDEVVFGLLPGDADGLRSTGELALAAMGGTRTHALALDGVLLPTASVTARLDRATWAESDSNGNANVQPSTPGIALAAVELLAERAPEVAARLRQRVLTTRADAYRLLDEVHPAEQVEERLALRADALLQAVEAATALLTARGGQGMGLADPAQRLLRAAAFQLVHSQAAHIRAATLEALVA